MNETTRQVLLPDYAEPVSAAECRACEHTTPAGAVCVQCQPFPTRFRCLSCQWRGPIITDEPTQPPTETIAPSGRNDNP
ncbi:MAG: hypothetical protein RL745_990 [Actinomycetota bacterium]